MSEPKPTTKPDSAKAPDPDPKPADPAGDVPEAPAGVGESTDPTVQQLLAERQTAVSNRQGLEADPDLVKAADQAIKDIDEKLAELGYK